MPLRHKGTKNFLFNFKLCDLVSLWRKKDFYCRGIEGPRGSFIFRHPPRRRAAGEVSPKADGQKPQITLIALIFILIFCVNLWFVFSVESVVIFLDRINPIL